MIVNLTPHALNIHTENGIITVPPSGQVARLQTISRPCPPVQGIPTEITSFCGAEGLPEPEEGTIFVVSLMVAESAWRDDVFSPGELIQDDQGRPIGCQGLRRSVYPR